MPIYPMLNNEPSSIINTQTFYGLNKGLSIAEGEMADMVNMSSDAYPVLSTRKARKAKEWPTLERAAASQYAGEIGGMLGTDRLILCHGGQVYMDGEPVGLEVSDEAHMLPKHMVSMGAYVCIWPDKVYFNVTNTDDKGPMGAKWSAEEGMTISAMMCRKDGTNYDMDAIEISDTAPAEPENLQMWLDTSGDVHVLKQYSTMYEQWIQVATTYIKLQADGLGKDFKDNDVVHLSGVAAEDETTSEPETSTETLTFPGTDVTLKSYYTTLESGKKTQATLAKKTTTITVEGIPDGATVTKAELRFTTNRTIWGGTIHTVNGIVFKEDQENLIPLDVTGNGEVSLQFVYKTNTYASDVGEHYGTLEITGMQLEVTYTTTTGTAGMSENDKKQLAALNTTNIIYARGDNYIIVAGILHKAVTLKNSLVAEMKIPDFDYVCEANNRLWGCSYATVEGKLTNEIRACALGDFRNWDRYMGLSTDSYAMAVGSDGQFTGAYSLQGVPLFFKEDFLHKITGTIPANFTLNTIKCRGVQDGSWRSLAVVNETLLYKARRDVMAYDGAMPYSISEKLGTQWHYEAVAGAYRDKYYINMRDDEASWHMYVYDTSRNLWHKEDDSSVRHMASVDGELILAVSKDEMTELLTVGGGGDEVFPWSVTFGTFGYQYEQQKYLSRFNIRMQMSAGSEMKVEMMYDSGGEWVEMGSTRCKELRTLLLPVIPRRCDHCQLRISGTGTIKLFSIARVLRQGSDGH